MLQHRVAQNEPDFVSCGYDLFLPMVMACLSSTSRHRNNQKLGKRLKRLYI